MYKNLPNYLSFKDGYLYYEGIKLFDLIEKYGSPLEVAYTDTINKKISWMKDLFSKTIQENSYKGKYFFAYASKANYYSEVVSTALNHVDFLETSSGYDLEIIQKLYIDRLIPKNFTIICNGYKKGYYFDKIISLRKRGLNIIPVLENADEVKMFLDQKVPLNVGMRINIDEQVARNFMDESRSGSGIDSRFGFYFNDMVEYAKKINQSEHLKFKLFHFHIGGTIDDTDEYIKFLKDLFENNYCVLKSFSEDLEYFDIGGGFPTQYSLSFNFDYKELVQKIIISLKEISDKKGQPHPHVIGEHGRYTVADHSFFLYEINYIKKSNMNSYWYMINSSLMTFLPDSWGLGQDFVVLPLNLAKNKMVKVKLGGITCDPDDTYYKQEKENYLLLPEVKEGEKLYLGIFGVGAYQEMIAGVGGVHHCLLPEGYELIIRKRGDKLHYNYANKLQSPRDILDILEYKNTHNLIQYLDKYDVHILDYRGPLLTYYDRLKEDRPDKEIFPYQNIEKAYKNKKYKVFLLYSKETVVGYAFIAILENNKIALLNYLSIFKEYRDKGYGHIFINELKNYFSSYYGIMVEVQKPETNDILNYRNRRLNFYKDLDFNIQSFNYEIKKTGEDAYGPMYILACNLKNNLDYEYKYGEMKEILDEYYSILFGTDYKIQYKLSPIKENIDSLN